ncbi:DUF6891 domain-containing protein [Mycolicibacterium aubagnense]|uniref:DUF6891 domain-containing protein n=1 Tax=Mycolicibacterium aubagnense TaxID=319707 RepID=A0ABN5YPV5_9MYCO|nr:hypothetical protein MAUB_14860 [Mycolicibacterium aubagnense]
MVRTKWNDFSNSRPRYRFRPTCDWPSDRKGTAADDGDHPYPYREWAYVYFHAQDADHLGAPDPVLYIAYSAWTYHSQLPREFVDAASRGEETAMRDAFERTEVLLGKQIVAAARNSDLTARWSGSRRERVCLQIRDRRKPLPPRAV